MNFTTASRELFIRNRQLQFAVRKWGVHALTAWRVFLIFCGKRVHERMFFGCESSLHWCKAASGQIWYGNFKVVSSWFSNTPEGYTKLLLIEFEFYRVSWTKLCMTLIINTKPMGHRSVKGKERGYITYYEVREDEVSKIVICSLSGIGSGLELRRLQRTDAF